jgi:hypothetical protein
MISDEIELPPQIGSAQQPADAVVAARRLMHCQRGLAIAVGAGVVLLQALIWGPDGIVNMTGLFTGPLAGVITYQLLKRSRRGHLWASSWEWPRTGHVLENKIPGLTQGRLQGYGFALLLALLQMYLNHLGYADVTRHWLPVSVLLTGSFYPMALATTLKMREHWVSALAWVGAALCYHFGVHGLYVVTPPLIIMGLLLHARLRDAEDAMLARQSDSSTEDR